ncbi:uncharacterized protein LOC119186476 [Rhipicephalus microplus]|uniref:uncharacterized protein LOC119186476 n=1 Tax=Rhipicephalus microplus TaxID=6941 RepID=UPI003F6D319B
MQHKERYHFPPFLSCFRFEDVRSRKKMFGLRKGNRWSCLSCKLELRSRSALRRHELIHVPYRERFTCQICNMIISRKDHLWRHMRRVHGVSQPSPMQLALTCPFCLKTMPNMSDLEQHVDSCHPYANGSDWAE